MNVIEIYALCEVVCMNISMDPIGSIEYVFDHGYKRAR